MWLMSIVARQSHIGHLQWCDCKVSWMATFTAILCLFRSSCVLWIIVSQSVRIWSYGHEHVWPPPTHTHTHTKKECLGQFLQWEARCEAIGHASLLLWGSSVTSVLSSPQQFQGRFEFNPLFTGEPSWKGLIAAFCRLALAFVRLIWCSSAVFCGNAAFTTSGALTEFPGCFRVQAVTVDLTSDSSVPNEDKCVYRGAQCFIV